ADIAEISESGKASATFAVGDTRTITFGDSELELMIAGFDHDDLADGSGKAGISIICNTLPSEITCAFGSYIYANASNTLRTYLNGTVLEMLPSDLQAVIKEISKPCDANYSSGNTSTIDVTGQLFPLSFNEVNNQPASTNFLTLGETYEAFSLEKASYKAYIHGATAYGQYLTRQNYHVGTVSSAVIDPNATKGYGFGVTSATYVRFCFCI
ncbi:MAG: hypothetical protein J6C37_10270, partial [Roseburia sp.]|nr:hypothetical protein [Roseburia sp.]